MRSRAVSTAVMAVMLTATELRLAAPIGAQTPSLTARQVFDRIKANIGVPWMEETVDTFKDGDPDTRVTGVAVTMMATFDVLQRAVEQGANLVITHEPTFFGHQDELGPLAAAHDSVTALKRAFIRNNRVVVLRMHDHWHRRHPDAIQTGMTRALAWQQFQRPESEHLFTLPETTLGELAASIRDKLGAPALRAVGDPKRRVSKVAMAPGFAGFPRHLVALRRDDVQVLVIGEAHEWETVEYVADAAAAGMDKSLIVVGHIPSEQAGMEDFAKWLAPLVKETTVRFVPAIDFFWLPK